MLPLLIVLLSASASNANEQEVTRLPLEYISPTYIKENRVLEALPDAPEGGDAILFGGHGPTAEGSKYFGIMLRLKTPTDLSDKCLAFDARTPQPGATRAFYVRAYNEGEGKPAWSFQSWGGLLTDAWRPFTLQQGMSLEGLGWEPGMVEDRVEFIIGTRDDDADVTAALANLRILPREPGIEDLTTPKTFVRDTVLVSGGEAKAVILHPDSDEGRAAAQTIADAIRAKMGVTIPARPATENDRMPRETAILLGNVKTNPALLLLYARFMTPVDAVCPGQEGALVHTVFDPFGHGVNAVVVGASDAAGLAKAASMFAEQVKAQPGGDSLVLPRIFERAYGEDFLAKYKWADDQPAPDRVEKGLTEGQAALDRGKHTSIAGVLANAARRYRLTGHSEEALLFVKLWELYEKSAVADPRKFGGPWGFDSDFPSKDVCSGWRIIEHDPALTDEQRLATVKSMARWLNEVVLPSCRGAVNSRHVPHNHQTFPALGTLFAGLYFTEGFDVAEGRYYLGVADAIFTRQAQYFKPYEDCNGYQWLTNGHLMRYTVARPDFTLYENGNAQRIIDFCIGCMDNLGYQAPYGDTGSWACWDSETICLDTFAFVTGDPHAAWAANLKHGLKKTLAVNAFQNPGRGEVPASKYDGVMVWPLEEQYYLTHGAANRPPFEACFDKVSFRERMDPQAPYLLLDGLSNGGHMHFDGNSIPRITQFGRIWLADNDYYKRPVKYHNSLMVFRDGESARIPAYVELLGAGETARYGYSRSRVNGYAGTDWERTIIWLKEQGAFVVLDTVTPHAADKYQLRLLWHGVGAAQLREEGLLLKQNGPSLWVQTAPGPNLHLKDDADLGANWKGYEFADPVVRSLSAIATVRLAEEEPYLFATAIHGAPKGEAAPWRIEHLAEGAGVLLHTGGGPVAIGLDSAPLPMPAGTLDTDAPVTVLDPKGLSVFGATRARAGDAVYRDADEPQDADVEMAGFVDSVGAVPTASPRANMETTGDAPPHKVLWRTALDAGDTVTRLAVARLDGPGAAPCLVAATRKGKLLAFKVDGTPRLEVAYGARLNDVAAVDLDGDGTDELIIGRQDEHVTALDASGKELWSRKLEYYRKPPYVNVIRSGDLDGDGVPEVVAGAENWRFYAFTADGTKLWNYEAVHPSRSGAVADLDGDGKDEVLCGTHYYYMSALKPDGTLLWKNSFGPICYDITTGSFAGDGTRGVVCGAGDGHLHVFAADGKRLLDIDTGDDVKHVATMDLDGDGKDEVVAGSFSHSVYCFGSDMTRRWRVDVGSPVTALATCPGEAPGIVAGTASGRLASLSPAGAIAATSDLGSEVVDVTFLEERLVAGTESGELAAMAATNGER